MKPTHTALELNRDLRGEKPVTKSLSQDITPLNQSHEGEVLLEVLSREFSSILYNPKVHWRLRKSPTLVRVMSYIS
jgi:hypothetical protein